MPIQRSSRSRQRLSHGSLLLVALWGLGISAAHAQRDLTDIPEPDPVAEIEAMTITDGAAVNLYAADPDIRKPIQINFDSRGRLWVASSEVYPQITPGGVANDKILVLEDTNGDGTCDKSTVFADGLLIPTGVIPDEQGGAYVAASTELLHLVDTTGDGVADQRRVVMSGFGTEDTHHLIHTLRWGPDGCLYFNQSIYIHSHIETAYGTRHLDGGGIWRYRPETGELSVFCKGFVNPWGHSFDAYGESFATDGAYVEGINYVFQDSVFLASPSEMRWLTGMNPGSPKHCGLEVISGSHFPESWWGDMVTSDFRGHRVCRFTVRPAGVSYSGNQQPEIVTSRHIAFRPIDARMGPDGAMYIADWYNPIIQHGEVDFRDDRRDRERGRIWRVHFPDSPLDHLPDFAAASVDELLGLLEDRSLPVRQFARQHLWIKIHNDAEPVLAATVRWRDAATDQATKATRALEHQWLGEVAGTFSADSFDLIATAEPGPASRPSLRSAVRAAGHDHDAVASRLTTAALGDHGPSKLEAVVALGQIASGPAAVEAAETLIAVAEAHVASSPDPTLDFALWQSLRKLAPSWVAALKQANLRWQPHAAGLAFAVSATSGGAAADAVIPLLSSGTLNDSQQQTLVAAIASSGDPAVLGKLLGLALVSVPPSDIDRPAEPKRFVITTLEQLVQRTNRDRAIPDNASRLLAQRFPTTAHLPVATAAKHLVITAAGLWKSEAMLPLLIDVAATAAANGDDDDDSEKTLTVTLRALANFESSIAGDELRRWATEGNALGHADAAIEATVALANRQPNRAAAAALTLLDELRDDLAANRLIVALRPNQAVAKRIAEDLAKLQLAPDRARSLLSAVRSAGGDEALEQAIRDAGRLDKVGWEPTPELAQEILTAVKKEGDPARGETIYRRTQLQCINCHAIGTAGGLVGPNLISLGSSSQLDYILESLWLPDAKLKEGYNTLNVLTDDGRATSGIPLGRDDNSLRLRLADGKEVEIPTDAIEVEQPGKSLMPAGLIDSLTQNELVDLVAFLAALGREPDYTVSTEPLVRQFETVVYSAAANKRLNRTSVDAVAADEEVFEWRIVTTQVNGTLPLAELDRFKQHGSTPFTSFVRFEVVVPEGQPAPRIELPTQAVDIWVNGKPTPAPSLVDTRLDPGRHQIVVGINRDAFDGQFRVKLVPRQP